jgi:histidinol-phosphatase (PHP family)
MQIFTKALRVTEDWPACQSVRTMIYDLNLACFGGFHLKGMEGCRHCEPLQGKKRYDQPMHDNHVHTSLCNHAAGSMEAYVQAAVSNGLTTICFLDHLTLQAAGRHNAMAPGELAGYVDDARRLARQYADRICVRVGLEVDFSPRHVDRCIELLDAVDLDVVGSSIHFLDGEDVVSRRSRWARGGIRADKVYSAYLAALESMLDYDYFDVICHLDLPKKYGRRPSARVVSKFADLLTRVRQKDLAVELNTSGWHCPVEEAFPSPELLGHCAALGIPVVLGSDAHLPEHVGRDFDRAGQLLRVAGYREVCGFSHRRRETIALDQSSVEPSSSVGGTAFRIGD